MNLTQLLKGKKVNYLTDARISVQLEIDDVKEERHSRPLEEATSKNDWWPREESWTTYRVKFTNGFTHSYSSLHEIELVE